ncbi:FAD-binding protein [Candidatus Pelagibacter communis]|uniref:FAD-binding protein n=1 Tax=Pelagibacter ubique TaxID=198252 RepID=UPI000AB41C0D|nr:FAD-binding protein [Candidatus Pelagibacter ubique]
MEEKQSSQTSLDFNQNVFKPSTREEIVEIVKNCFKKNIPLEINGLKSKNKIGRNFQSEKTLDLSSYSGVIEYKPEELYIKVKAGTPIKEIVKQLDKNNQQLAFEPNDFGYLFSGESNSGSIGGVVSCNFAGSRRFKVGSVRDHVLGFQGLNGKGETIKSGGTVVKNVTGYDLCKLLSGSFGTLSILTELSIKVLPKPETSKTLVIKNPHLKKALSYLGQSLSSSTDPSGGVFYPDYFGKNFILNDLTHEGGLTAIRIEGPTNSVDQRIDRLSKELKLLSQEISILDTEQSNIFWNRTKNLEVFKNLKSNLLRIVVPISETLQVIQKLKSNDVNYFIDWGGSLVWMAFNEINSKILNETKQIVKKHHGYYTIIKIEEDLKASADVFTIDPIKYKISEKIKRSFDPKRIFNPGKMYTGI